MAYSQVSRPTGAPALAPEAAEAQGVIRKMTEGRATDLANDPYQNSVMDYLKGVVGGQNAPYNQTVQNSILAQQGAGAASAEAAQMQTLRDSLGASGGSIYDPGYQAAQRQAMSQRQGSNLDAAGQMAGKAAVENQKAQMQGAGQLAAARGSQNAQINQMSLAGADMRARTAVPVGAGAAGGGAAGGGAGGGAGAAGGGGSPVGAGPASMTPPRSGRNLKGTGGHIFL